jgi:hypothetical protein
VEDWRSCWLSRVVVEVVESREMMRVKDVEGVRMF